MQFAYQFPERLNRLVLVDSGGLGGEVALALRAATLPGSDYVLPLLSLPVRGAGALAGGVWASWGFSSPVRGAGALAGGVLGKLGLQGQRGRPRAGRGLRVARRRAARGGRSCTPRAR